MATKRSGRINIKEDSTIEEPNFEFENDVLVDTDSDELAEINSLPNESELKTEICEPEAAEYRELVFPENNAIKISMPVAKAQTKRTVADLNQTEFRLYQRTGFIS